MRVEAWFSIAAAFLRSAAVFEVGGDSDRSEGVIADLGGDAGAGGARPIIALALACSSGVAVRTHPPPLIGAEQRPLRIAAQGAAVEIGSRVWQGIS